MVGNRTYSSSSKVAIAGDRRIVLLGISILIADFMYKGFALLRNIFPSLPIAKCFGKQRSLVIYIIIEERFHGHFEMIKAQLFYEHGYKMAVRCIWLVEGVEAWVGVVRALVFGWRNVVSRKIFFYHATC